MTDTVISDGYPFPHDEGLPNISDGNEDWNSGGTAMALAQAVDSGSYVRSDSELTFTGHDGTNDEVDVTSGIAYLDLAGETVNYQSSLGGSSAPAYDTALPTLPSIMVVVPTTVTNLSATSATLNDFWLAYATDGTVTGVSAGDVYIRHGSGLSAPPHPNVKLGQANPDDSTADVLDNRGGSPTFESVSTDDISVTNALVWQEDNNSPVSGTGSQSYSITLSSSYDLVLVHLSRFENTSGSGQSMGIRVNGDTTSNYKFIDVSGTRTTAGSQWVLRGSLTSGDELAGTLIFDGTYADAAKLSANISSPAAGADILNIGANTNVTSPLDSITFRGGTGTTAIDARVYGWSDGL